MPQMYTEVYLKRCFTCERMNTVVEKTMHQISNKLQLRDSYPISAHTNGTNVNKDVTIKQDI